jgi:hypothetical protein
MGARCPLLALAEIADQGCDSRLRAKPDVFIFPGINEMLYF